MFTSSRRTFYLRKRLDSADFVNGFCRLPNSLVDAGWDRRNDPRFERESIVHRVSEVLLAAEITFRSLNRRVAEQELNLLKFTAARMT
jgi:hypothetical protein